MASAPASSGTRGAALQPRSAARVLLTLLLLAITDAALAEEAAPGWAAVGALFRDRCVMCHSRDAASRGLRLDSYAGALADGENGPVLIRRDAASSALMRRLLGESRPRMPFLSTSLSPAEIALVERWIAAGLPETAPPPPGAPSDERLP
jgi:mono/diheme cytochrome c family protein